MRAMVLIRTDDPLAGVRIDERHAAAMDRFDDRLVHAGVLLAAEGLHPGRDAIRLRMTDGSRSIVGEPDGPALGGISGFWLWQVRSLDEAVEWARRAPLPADGATELEIRQVLAPGDRPGTRR